MATLTEWEARRLIASYSNSIEQAAHNFSKNFSDMDFENNNRKREVESIIEQMINDCEGIKRGLNNLQFES